VLSKNSHLTQFYPTQVQKLISMIEEGRKGVEKIGKMDDPVEVGRRVYELRRWREELVMDVQVGQL
jgi:hypothetical protein